MPAAQPPRRDLVGGARGGFESSVWRHRGGTVVVRSRKAHLAAGAQAPGEATTGPAAPPDGPT
jgi:hypothetical protein